MTWQANNKQKLLWDDERFSKLSQTGEGFTRYYGGKLLLTAGLAEVTENTHLTILDNCCGSGVITKDLHELLQHRSPDSFDITCGDLADAMVESTSNYIRAAGWTNTKALKVDAQDTKLFSDHFTHIITNFGIMLVPNASKMLSECHRMLKSNGICALTTWKKVGWLDDFRAAFHSMPDLPSFPSPERFRTAFTDGQWDDELFIHNQLRQHGFGDIKIEAVPNTSVAPAGDEFRSVLKPIMTLIYRYWSDEEKQTYGNKTTEDRVERWFDDKYNGRPITWDWIALLSTGQKM